MDINLTLLGEMLTFAVFLWVMVKYVWPQLTKSIEERKQQIADGIEAARQGQMQLSETKQDIAKQLEQTKKQVAIILEQAQKKADDFLAETKASAKIVKEKILAQAEDEIQQEINRAGNLLKQQISDLVIVATERVLARKIDAEDDRKLVDQVISSI